MLHAVDVEYEFLIFSLRKYGRDRKKNLRSMDLVTPDIDLIY